MNHTILIGNVVRDPELKTTPSGIANCTFTIAVNRKFKDKNGDNVTDFIPIVTWRKTAELCADYLAKGRKVAIVGELQTRSYETKDGTKRTVTEVVAEEVEFLTPKGESNDSGRSRGRGRDKQPEPDMEGFMDISDDDLPFN